MEDLPEEVSRAVILLPVPEGRNGESSCVVVVGAVRELVRRS